MQPSASSGLSLTASQRKGARPLASEEGADFDVFLTNGSGSSVTVRSIDNTTTARLSLYDSAGHSLGEYDAMERRERVVGHTGTQVIQPPDEVTLGPGEKEEQSFFMWAFREPLPPGKYAFSAVHELSPGNRITSPRVPIEIRPARVESMALAFDGPARLNSLTAWISKMEGSARPRLLIRQSGFTSHAVAQVGATSNGEFAEGSLVALGAMPMHARFPPFQWAAVVSGARLQMIQHSMGVSHWHAPVITLPASDAVPVPRFPNRQHAVFLATATTPAGPALVGVVVNNSDAVPVPWTIRLRALPTQTACAFSMQGAISVLYATDDGKTSRLYRVGVNENGGIAEPEALVHESSNETLAVTTDMRPGQPTTFVIVEADRVRHNSLAFVKVPLAGTPVSTNLREFQGWPAKAEARGTTVPLKAVSVAFDLDAAGLPWLALVTENGEFVGGRLDGSLHDLRESQTQRCSWPQVAGLAGTMTLSCFAENGMLFHHRMGADDH